jgi:hypothetical protein
LRNNKHNEVYFPESFKLAARRKQEVPEIEADSMQCSEEIIATEGC